jgi:hypothetical protein
MREDPLLGKTNMLDKYITFKNQLVLAAGFSLITTISYILQAGSFLEVFSYENNVLRSSLELIMGVFTLYTFKTLLNRQFKVKRLDFLIKLLIISLIFVIAGDFVFTTLKVLERFALVYFIIFVYFSSVTLFILARRILALKIELFGLKKAYCYTALALSVCMMLILLIPLGFLIGIVNEFIFALIFVRAAQSIKPQ